MEKNIDLAIIGGGVAGVSAAVYAKRAGLDCALFEAKIIGGQLTYIENIHNYVGLTPGTRGSDFSEKLNETISNFGITLLNEEIINLSINSQIVKISSIEERYNVKGLIVTSGASPKQLDINGEKEYLGKGVSYCAICDGFFFKNKDVAVIGGGNSAVEEAIYLSNICHKVTLIHRRDTLRAIESSQKELFKHKNIEIIYNSIPKKIDGKDFIENITLEDTITKKTSTLKLNGLFVAIGLKPATEIFKNKLAMDDSGFIITNEEMKTSCDFIWAAGDCRQRPLRQLITAASDGAIAALSAYKHLKGGYISA